MTNDNYTTMSNQDIVEITNPLNKNPSRFNIFLANHYPKLLGEIINRTFFLDEHLDRFKNGKVPIQCRLYCLDKNITSFPVCSHPECTNQTRWDSSSVGFKKYCCVQCMNSDSVHIENVKKSNLKNYGVTCSFQRDDVRAKIEDILMRNYGVKNYSQTKQFKQQVALSWRRKTEDELHAIDLKRRTTNKQNLGVEIPMQSEAVKIKAQQTNNDRFGVNWCVQSDIVRKKSKESLKNKLGVEQSFLSEIVRNKAKKCMLEHHGVEYFPQSEEYHKKAHKRYRNKKYPDMTFGSSWEFIVYDFLLENHIVFEYQPAISIPYEYDGTHHTYHPDFLVGGRIYEVKGDNFFRYNENTGKEEMSCPYRGKDWTDEHHEWMCGLYEAKHQCMISNNVTILRQYQIKNLSVDMFV